MAASAVRVRVCVVAAAVAVVESSVADGRLSRFDGLRSAVGGHLHVSVTDVSETTRHLRMYRCSLRFALDKAL